MRSKQIGKEKNDTEFARLLENNLQNLDSLNAGDHKLARIAGIEDGEFVSVQTDNGPGVIRREELLDAEGNIGVNVGEKVDAFFLDRANGEQVFTTQPVGRAKSEILNTAMQQRIPLRGRIAQKIKGGFEIALGDVMAFCPASQMPNEDEGRGRSGMEFLIIEIQGKRVIASRRSFRDMQREASRSTLMETMEEGDIVEGEVVSLQNFGAFVDLGGIEGLVPLSELDFVRVRHPGDVLKAGQSVRVKVLSIDWKEDRITLSRRALLQNPWQGQLPFEVGEIIEGRIESLKNFGMFVRITDSFTGLVPNSESGVPRGQPLDKEFRRGETVRVMVTNIDRDRERISLSVTRVFDADSRAEYEQYMQKQEDAEAGGMSSFGKQLMAAMQKGKDE